MLYRLSITSWADRSHGAQSGATHYYGRVRYGTSDRSFTVFELEHEVKIKDPAYADDSLRCRYAKPNEKMLTSRWAIREELLAAFREFLWSEAKPTDEVEIA